MSDLNNRVKRLEDKRPEAGAIYATRPDGSTYKITTWKELVEADRAGHLDNCPEWQEFIERSKEQTS